MTETKTARRYLAPLSLNRVQDFAATVITTAAKGERRDRARYLADVAGMDSCEICGRAVAPDRGAEAASLEDGSAMYFGDTCLRKMIRAGVVPRP